jgi:hypothetical protein
MRKAHVLAESKDPYPHFHLQQARLTKAPSAFTFSGT